MVKVNPVGKSDKVVKGRELDRLQQYHSDKIKEIRNRKPFTSPTLDNRPPTTLNSALLHTNKRKEANLKYLSSIRERDNK